VLRGIDNGVIVVTAKPNESVYSNNNIEHSVKILIITPFFLHPARSLIVLPYTKIEYSLFR
jgi:hypothetical protein